MPCSSRGFSGLTVGAWNHSQLKNFFSYFFLVVLPLLLGISFCWSVLIWRPTLYTFLELSCLWYCATCIFSLPRPSRFLSPQLRDRLVSLLPLPALETACRLYSVTVVRLPHFIPLSCTACFPTSKTHFLISIFTFLVVLWWEIKCFYHLSKWNKVYPVAQAKGLLFRLYSWFSLFLRIQLTSTYLNSSLGRSSC